MKKTCLCIPEKRRAHIQAAMDFAVDFSDGAFFAYMEENGIDFSELEIFADQHECPEPKK